MSTKEQYWKYSLIIIIIGLGIILFRQITPFLSGLLGAFMGHRTKRFFQWSGKMGERF